MAHRKKRLTIIVVPQTGKRPVSFQFSPVWFPIVGALFAGMITAIVSLTQLSQNLRQDLITLEDLQEINRQQQAEIDAMAIKVQETEDRLQVLQSLEKEIQELTTQGSLPVSQSETPGLSVNPSLGRGGPEDPQVNADSLPLLSGALPSDVRDHIFTRRAPAANGALPGWKAHLSPRDRLEKAEHTNAQLTEQLVAMDQLAASLTKGKEAILDHLDYIAHRPTGYPVSSAQLTDRFGWRWSPFGWGRQYHEGIDLAQSYWTPIVSTADGVVVFAGWKSGGYGYTVIIEHGYGFQTLYGHMIDWDVRVGDSVERGTTVGWVGSTGNSTGPHVHYEVHVNGIPVDPIKYLK